MKISAIPYKLQFKKPFRIAHGVRTETDTVFIKAEQDGITGWGEAALPPYFHEDVASVKKISESFQPDDIDSEETLFDTINELQNIPDNYAAKAAIEMALLDWTGKKFKKNIAALLQINVPHKISTSYTIPIDTVAETEKNISNANNFPLLKIKLGSEHDDEVIEYLLHAKLKKSFFADANQGWKNKEEALRKIELLHKAGALFIEQPLPAHAEEEQYRLRQDSPLPIIGDESVQTINDIDKAKELFNGINIKLVKCGGLINGLKMIALAKSNQLITMTGCMSESSCAVSAATYLATQTGYADLDGPLLISNNPFTGLKFEYGKVIIPHASGLGVSTDIF
jgi:L-Ala-D/L-Glu epimerase